MGWKTHTPCLTIVLLEFSQSELSISRLSCKICCLSLAALSACLFAVSEEVVAATFDVVEFLEH
jgi:hypothetical protein